MEITEIIEVLPSESDNLKMWKLYYQEHISGLSANGMVGDLPEKIQDIVKQHTNISSITFKPKRFSQLNKLWIIRWSQL